MRFSAQGLVVYSKPVGERSVFLQCITQSHGLLSGISGIPKSHKGRASITVGNLVSINYYGREHSMGKIVAEVKKSYTSLFLSNKIKLFSAIGICSLLRFISCNNEGVTNQESLLEHVLDFFDTSIQSPSDIQWRASFVLAIKKILCESGYGFSLTQCVATGTRDSDKLKFLSPKSGCAVCADAAEPYKNLLLPLPKFFITEDSQDALEEGDILDSLMIVQRFLRKIESAYGKKAPEHWENAKNLLMTAA